MPKSLNAPEVLDLDDIETTAVSPPPTTDFTGNKRSNLAILAENNENFKRIKECLSARGLAARPRGRNHVHDILRAASILPLHPPSVISLRVRNAPRRPLNVLSAKCPSLTGPPFTRKIRTNVYLRIGVLSLCTSLQFHPSPGSIKYTSTFRINISNSNPPPTPP